MCAAPGGKSIHLAKAKGGTTKVLSRDISWEKLELIEENRVRCHADNMQIDGEEYSLRELHLEDSSESK